VTDQASLDNEINLQLPSGSAGITAAALRGVLHDMNVAIFQGALPSGSPVAAGYVPNSTAVGIAGWTSALVLGSSGLSGGSIVLNGLISGNVALSTGSVGGGLVASVGSAGLSVISGGNTLISTIAGIQAGLPTGGGKGIGNINLARALYLNNSQLADGSGNLYTPGPVTISTGTAGSLSSSSQVFGTLSGTFTVLLPNPVTSLGRWLFVRNTSASVAVKSASSNVVPINSLTPGTAILAASAGKWASLQSDGTNWIIMMAN